MKQEKKEMIRGRLYRARREVRKFCEDSRGGESEENETGRISGTGKETGEQRERRQ